MRRHYRDKKIYNSTKLNWKHCSVFGFIITPCVNVKNKRRLYRKLVQIFLQQGFRLIRAGAVNNGFVYSGSLSPESEMRPVMEGIYSERGLLAEKSFSVMYFFIF